MKRIEFLGAPGVGKTTIVNHLISKRSSNKHWVMPILVYSATDSGHIRPGNLV